MKYIKCFTKQEIKDNLVAAQELWYKLLRPVPDVKECILVLHGSMISVDKLENEHYIKGYKATLYEPKRTILEWDRVWMQEQYYTGKYKRAKGIRMKCKWEWKRWLYLYTTNDYKHLCVVGEDIESYQKNKDYKTTKALNIKPVTKYEITTGWGDKCEVDKSDLKDLWFNFNN